MATSSDDSGQRIVGGNRTDVLLLPLRVAGRNQRVAFPSFPPVAPGTVLATTIFAWQRMAQVNRGPVVQKNPRARHCSGSLSCEAERCVEYSRFLRSQCVEYLAYSTLKMR